MDVRRGNSSSSSSNPPAPCRFYAQGRCDAGDSCKFRHASPEQQQQQQHNPDDICYSGGALGADLVFGEFALSAGHAVIHWTFAGKGGYQGAHGKVLSTAELAVAKQPVKAAARFLKRNEPRDGVVKNLIYRNYYQVKDAERVYAVTRWNLPDGGNQTVEFELGGGTGWAVAMAIQLKCPEIYLYALERKQWYAWVEDRWKPLESTPPRPHGRYAGIGSRDLAQWADQKYGNKVIQALYEQ